MAVKRKLKKKNIIIIIAVLVLLIGAVIGISLVLKSSGKVSTLPEIIKTKETTTTTTTTTTKVLKIFDENSKSRNIAVMINNIKNVWGYQSGVQDAYIVYEIIAEGGITRLMAVFKDQDNERIGTVRSARIYYLDYALENDAIYVHIGGSKEALKDIKTLSIPDLQSEVTFRDRSIGLAYEHTAFASMSKIQEKIKKRGIRNTKKKDELLQYSIDEINLNEMPGAIPANEVFIRFSGSKSTSFKYDAEKKVYKRYQNDIEHIDYVTKEQYTVKNIITYQVQNKSYDSYGRQELANIGKGTGYYITNGYAVPITWEKSARDEQTVYKYQDGKEITVNDGNTHIEIQPKNKKFEIK